MLTDAAIIGFIPVTDLAAAQKFYHGALGLQVVKASDGFALVLAAANSAMIRCVLTPDAKPRPFTILGWQVPDLPAAVADLRKHKIQPILYPHFNQDADGIWTAPTGDQVVWFNDPDGNILSLSHHV